MQDDTILDDLLSDLGVENPKDLTPEDKFFRELTEGKFPKLYNCQYWLKQELYVYTHLFEKNWIVSKLSGPYRTQVPTKQLARAFLEYYFFMTALPKFENERGTEMKKSCDMQKFLDLVIEYAPIKNLIENPKNLI